MPLSATADPIYRTPETPSYPSGFGYGDSGMSMDVTPSAVPEEELGAGLSFENDIQPMSKRILRAAYSNLKAPGQASAFFNRANQGLQQAFVTNSQLQEFDDRARDRRLKYESSRLVLDSAREAARKEKNMLTGLAPIMAEFDNLLSDPDMDADTRRKEHARLSLRYSGEAATNPAVANVIRASQYGVEQDKKNSFTVAAYAAQGGSPTYLAKQRARQGGVLNPDDPIDDIVGALEDRDANTFDKYVTKEKEDTANRMAYAEQERTARLLKELGSLEMIVDPTTGGRVFKAPGQEAVARSYVERFLPHKLAEFKDAKPEQKAILAAEAAAAAQRSVEAPTTAAPTNPFLILTQPK